MNRKEKRNALKSINTPKKFEEAMGMALKMQRKDMEEQFEKQRENVVDVILTMVAYTIQYKLGLGKKRLPEIMKSILDNIDAFNTGHLSEVDYETIKKELEKYGVSI